MVEPGQRSTGFCGANDDLAPALIAAQRGFGRNITRHGASRGLYQLMDYHLRPPFEPDSASRDNTGAPTALARWGGSGAASPDLGRTYH
jgi:hypothetical protein